MDTHQMATPPVPQDSPPNHNVVVDDLIAQQLQNELNSASHLGGTKVMADLKPHQPKHHETISNHGASSYKHNTAFQLDLVDLCTELEGLYYECTDIDEFFNHVASNLSSRASASHPLSGIEVRHWMTEVCQERKQALLARKIPPYRGDRENLDRAIDGWLEIEGRRGMQQAVSDLTSSYLLAFGPEESTPEFLFSPACRHRTSKNNEHINEKTSETGKTNSVASMRLIQRIEALGPRTAPATAKQFQGPDSRQHPGDLAQLSTKKPNALVTEPSTSPQQPGTTCDSSTLRSFKDLQLDRGPAVKTNLFFAAASKTKPRKKTKTAVFKVDDSSMHSLSNDEPYPPSSSSTEASPPGSTKKSKQSSSTRPKGTPPRARPFGHGEGRSPFPFRGLPETPTKPSLHSSQSRIAGSVMKSAGAGNRPSHSTPTTPQWTSRYMVSQSLTPRSERKRKLLDLDVENADVIDLTHDRESIITQSTGAGYRVHQQQQLTVEQRLSNLEKVVGSQEDQMDIFDM